MKVYVRPAFYLDLEKEQLWLLEHADAAVADQWHEAVWKTIGFLKSWPEVGRLRKDLDFAGVRSWRVDSRMHRHQVSCCITDSPLNQAHSNRVSLTLGSLKDVCSIVTK